MSSFNLWNICQNKYFPLRTKIRCQKTRRHYRYSLNSFEKYLGREATSDDLNDETVTLWLNDLLFRGEQEESARSMNTSLSYVTRVLTLWRWLFHKRMVETYPLLDMPAAPEPSPIALDADQLQRLFESAMCRPGFVCEIPARYWWTALFGTAFCTSERKGALFALRWEWVSLDNRIAVVPAAARKGRRKTATYPLWEEVVWLLDRIIQPQRELVFPWNKSEATFYHQYARILRDAQIPNTRKMKLHSLRVSHNTWHKAMTGRHSPLLLHSSSATSERHYEDKRFTTPPPQKLFIPWKRPDAG